MKLAEIVLILVIISFFGCGTGNESTTKKSDPFSNVEKSEKADLESKNPSSLNANSVSEPNPGKHGLVNGLNTEKNNVSRDLENNTRNLASKHSLEVESDVGQNFKAEKSQIQTTGEDKNPADLASSPFIDKCNQYRGSLSRVYDHDHLAERLSQHSPNGGKGALYYKRLLCEFSSTYLQYFDKVKSCKKPNSYSLLNPGPLFQGDWGKEECLLRCSRLMNSQLSSGRTEFSVCTFDKEVLSYKISDPTR